MTDQTDKPRGLADDKPARGGRPARRSREAKPPRESHPWSAQDRRTLLMAFAGTLAANVATVIVVALAVLIARWMFALPAGPRHGSYTVGWVTTGIILVLVAFTGLVWRRRRDRPSLLPFGFYSVFLLLMILAWFGVAVGIGR